MAHLALSMFCARLDYVADVLEVPIHTGFSDCSRHIIRRQAHDDLSEFSEGMEVIMLEQYYLKPTTLDRIRACWMADAIESYVGWLTENQYAARSVLRRVPMLLHFADFAQARGAAHLADLPGVVSPNRRKFRRVHRGDVEAAARFATHQIEAAQFPSLSQR